MPVHHNPPTQLDLFKWKRLFVQANKDFFNKLPKQQKEALRIYKFSAYQEINKYLRAPEHERFVVPFGEFRLDKKDTVMPKALFAEYSQAIAKITPATQLSTLGNMVQRYHYDAYYNAIQNLDKIFKSPAIPKLASPATITEPVILYKGTRLPHSTVSKPIGSNITFGEYLSTSVDPEVATTFTFINWIEPATVPVIFIIKNYDTHPLGQRYIYIDFGPTATGKMETMKYTPFSDEYEVLLPRGCQFKITAKYKTADFNKYFGSLPEKVAVLHAGPLYSNIGKVRDSFFGKKEVKELLDRKFEIQVMELEFISCNPATLAKLTPANKQILTDIRLEFSKLIPAKHKSGKLSSKTKTTNSSTKTKKKPKN